jgi:hypothetical protein
MKVTISMLLGLEDSLLDEKLVHILSRGVLAVAWIANLEHVLSYCESSCILWMQNKLHVWISTATTSVRRILWNVPLTASSLMID